MPVAVWVQGTDDPDLREAIRRAVALPVSTQAVGDDPHSHALLAMLARTSGIAELRSALDPAIPVILRELDPADPARRIVDPAAEVAPDDLPSGSAATLPFGRAVTCRDGGLEGPEVRAAMEDGARDDGYEGTHVLLAALVADELGCEPAWLPAVRERSVRSVAAGLAASPATVDDLNVERLALLAAAGRPYLVDGAWTHRVVAAQAPDGSWSPSHGQGSVHTTALALWFLLQQVDPSAAGPILAPPA